MSYRDPFSLFLVVQCNWRSLSLLLLQDPQILMEQGRNALIASFPSPFSLSLFDLIFSATAWIFMVRFHSDIFGKDRFHQTQTFVRRLSRKSSPKWIMVMRWKSQVWFGRKNSIIKMDSLRLVARGMHFGIWMRFWGGRNKRKLSSSTMPWCHVAKSLCRQLSITFLKITKIY